MMDKSLGKRIRALRELRKLSQEKVAEKCGVETSSVSRWETGGLSPNSKHLTQLAKALEVNKSDFFIAPESPVPENVLLAEILKVAHDLSPQRIACIDFKKYLRIGDQRGGWLSIDFGPLFFEG